MCLSKRVILDYTHDYNFDSNKTYDVVLGYFCWSRFVAIHIKNTYFQFTYEIVEFGSKLNSYLLRTIFLGLYMTFLIINDKLQLKVLPITRVML